MNIKTLLKICKATGRTIPCDMQDQINETYYSESKAEHVSIADMDIVHLIRAFNKMKNDKEIVKAFDDLIKRKVN